jgi:hypothetical protein
MSGVLGGLIGSFASSPVGAYESIQTIAVTSNTNSISFTSIPSTYTHLQIRMTTMSNLYSVPGLRIRFNSDTASNYSFHNVASNGASSFSQQNSNATSMSIVGVGAGDRGANMVGVNIIDILDYASTNKYKTLRALGGNEYNGSSNNFAIYSGNWRNTAALTTIYMETDTQFTAYSYFALYGIKG